MNPSKPRFFNGNCVYYPDNVFMDANEIYLTTTPKTYEGTHKDDRKFFINDVEIQPSNDFKKVNGKYIKYNDARLYDSSRYQGFEYEAPPLQYNSNVKDLYYRPFEGNQLGSHPTYASLDTGHNRYYVTDSTMSPYPDMNYPMNATVQRTLKKYPNGTLVPYYHRVLEKDIMGGYEGTSDFLKNSAYFREDFMEIRSRDMNSRDYSLNYFM
jgi:hypothetical protein